MISPICPSMGHFVMVFEVLANVVRVGKFHHKDMVGPGDEFLGNSCERWSAMSTPISLHTVTAWALAG